MRSTNKRIISGQGQWLGDVAITHAGSVEALFDLAVKHNLSPTGELHSGEQFVDMEVENRRVTNYYSRNNLNPATANVGIDKMKGRGIGNMTVNVDFVVNKE